MLNEIDFWLKVVSPSTFRYNEVRCEFWDGEIDRDGYGRLKVDGQTVMAHRKAYELGVGSIPDGLDLDHLCHTAAVQSGMCQGGRCLHRRCVEPTHLEPVTKAINNQRRRHKNSKKTQCPEGHLYTEENTLYSAQGYRRCRECNRKWQSKRNYPNAKPGQQDRVGRSGFKGVSQRGDRWDARIHQDGKMRHLGSFDCGEDAAKCFDEAAKLLHGERAILNFPSV